MQTKLENELIATSEGLSNEDNFAFNYIYLESPLVVSWHHMFPLIIQHVKFPSLDVLSTTTSSYIESTSEGPSSILSAPAFDPSLFVKKEYFDQVEDKTEAFIEQTSKN